MEIFVTDWLQNDFTDLFDSFFFLRLCLPEKINMKKKTFQENPPGKQEILMEKIQQQKNKLKNNTIFINYKINKNIIE